MANTTSWAWPNIFNVAQNKVAIYEDNQSVVSRCRLLLLTDPTEIYNEPMQGVGLRRYMYRYNTDNVKAEIRDRAADQFELFDPSVNAPETQYVPGLQFTGDADNSIIQKYNQLEMTLSVQTIYGDTLEISSNDIV